MLTSNKIIMDEVDVSVDQESPGYWLDQVYGVAFQAVFSGSPTGTVHLEGSNDRGLPLMPGQPPSDQGVVTWNEILNSNTAVTGAGPVTWNYNGVFYRWIRLVYVAISGTGTVTVTVNTKGA